MSEAKGQDSEIRVKNIPFVKGSAPLDIRRATRHLLIFTKLENTTHSPAKARVSFKFPEREKVILWPGCPGSRYLRCPSLGEARASGLLSQ